jgi:hypothetical protein
VSCPAAVGVVRCFGDWDDSDLLSIEIADKYFWFIGRLRGKQLSGS